MAQHVGTLTIEQVVAMARDAHRERADGLSIATEGDIRARGPYHRWMIGGNEIGDLRFQPQWETSQVPIRQSFAAWKVALTREELERHEGLMAVLRAGRAFTHAPIYRRDRFVIDGAHRSLAAFDVVTNHDPSVAIEIYAEWLEA